MESTSYAASISVDQEGDSDTSRTSVVDDTIACDTPHGKRKAADQLESDQYKRFKITREEDIHKWSLPNDLASYANDASEEFIPEKELKEQVLLEAPRPVNLDAIKVLDEALSSNLKRIIHKASKWIECSKKFRKRWVI